MDKKWYRKTHLYKKLFAFDGYRIDDAGRYLADRGYQNVRLVKKVELSVLGFRQSVLEGGVNNCSLCSITRVVQYAAEKKGTYNTTLKNMYWDIKSYAAKHGYSDNRGTPFYRIKSVFKYALMSNGIKGRRIITRPSFFDVDKYVCDILDNEMPLLINIAFGYYANHTVTCIGYERYEVIKNNRRTTRLFLRVIDGWNEGESLFDWDSFRKSLSLGIGTFTIIV